MFIIPVTYSPQYLFTKSYQYLSPIILFNTMHDSLDNPTPTVLAQGSIYIFTPPLFVLVPPST